MPTFALRKNSSSLDNCTTNIYTMAIFNLTLKRALLALPFIAVSASASAAPVKRDFDTIRDFHSYDPATETWDKIEDFDTVDIIDPSETREGRYIYRDFWAYDDVTRRWYKVDIRDYGYKRSKAAVRKAKKKKPKSASRKSPFGFMRHWVLGLRGGGGMTFHIVRVNRFGIVVDKNGKYNLQTPEQESRKRGGYRPNWYGNIYEPLQTDNELQSKAQVKSDKKITLRGEGANIPLTMFTHYTFFKRIRLGGGGIFEVNYLQKLRPKADASNLPAFEVATADEWFFNTAWYGLLGLRILHAPDQDFFLDLQAGQNYNQGSDLERRIEKETCIYDGWLFGMGVTHERRLNNYFKWITRLGVDWKIHDDTPEKVKEKYKDQDEKPFIDLHQIAAHLDMGIQVSFGKNKKEEGYETEHDGTSAQDSFEKQKSKLEETGKAVRKAQERRRQLEGNLKWKLR